MKRPLRAPCPVLVLVLVFAPGAWLGAEEPPAPAPAAPLEGTSPTRIPLPHPVPDETDWYGVYQGREKVGWAMLGIVLEKGEAPRYVSRSRIQADLEGLGVQVSFSFETEDVFRGESPFDLLSSREVKDEGPRRRRLRLDRDREDYVVTVDAGAGTEHWRLENVDYTLADRLTHVHWAMGGLEAGQVIDVSELDITELRPDVYHYEVARVHRQRARGVEITVYEVRMRSALKGPLGTLWIDTEGRMLRGPLAGVAELRIEPREQAQDLGRASDLFAFGRVPVNLPLGDARTVRRLVLAVYGRGADVFRPGPRQAVAPGEDGAPLVLTGEAAGGDEAPDVEQAAALGATDAYPAADPRLVALAREAAAGAGTDEGRIEALTRYVARFLQDVHLAQPYPVLDLLREKVGDARDHARLFVTLARALSLPAREVHGLVYLGDEALAFGGHAWCEVAVDGRWLPVDPTWDQVPADATHVALERGGGGWVEMLARLGRLGLERRDVEHSTP